MRTVNKAFYLLACLYALPNVLMPTDGNTSIFEYVARGWLNGSWPYESALDHKPPALYMIYALAALTLGQNSYSVRLFELAAILMTGHCIGAALAREHHRWHNLGGPAALLMAAFYYTHFDFFSTGGAELWEGLFLLSAWCAANAGVSPRRCFWVGTLGGAAFLVKFPAAIPFVGITVLLVARQDGIRRQAHAAVVVMSGFAVMTAVVCLPFLLTGRGHVMWEATVYFNAFYSTATQLSKQSPLAWFWFEYATTTTSILSVLTSIAVAKLLTEREWSRLQFLAQVAFVGTLTILTVIAQGKYLHYHWAVASPFVAVGLLWGILVVSDCRPGGIASLVLLCACATLIWTPGSGGASQRAMLHYRTQFIPAWRYLTGSSSRERFLRPYASMYYAYSSVERLAVHARRHKRAAATLCTHGMFAPLIYTASGLRCPSRFFADHVLSYIRQAQGRAGTLASWLDEHQRMLSQNPPTFLLTSGQTRTAYWDRSYKILAREGHLQLLQRSD